MKRLNKKGFTLIELLAVIVVLAIIMVIATQQVNKTISKSRANSFIESYQMIAKQVKTFIASDEDADCGSGTGQTACLTKYDLADDYTLSVTKASTNDKYTIVLSANTSNGKFKNVDLTKYGDVAKTTNASETSGYNCKISGVDGNSTCTKNSITGEISF